jgi:hypothetical protein
MNQNKIYCENIVKYPYVDVPEGDKTFREFAEECSQNVGGSTEEWMKQNKNVLGLFDTKNKKLNKNTSFKIPDSIVTEATDTFFNSLSPSPSPQTSPPRVNASPRSSFDHYVKVSLDTHDRLDTSNEHAAVSC